MPGITSDVVRPEFIAVEALNLDGDKLKIDADGLFRNVISGGLQFWPDGAEERAERERRFEITDVRVVAVQRTRYPSHQEDGEDERGEEQSAHSVLHPQGQERFPLYKTSHFCTTNE